MKLLYSLLGAITFAWSLYQGIGFWTSLGYGLAVGLGIPAAIIVSAIIMAFVMGTATFIYVTVRDKIRSKK